MQKSLKNGVKSFLSLFLLLTILTGCAPKTPKAEPSAFTDALGNPVSLKKGARVVAAYGSFADCWILSGGMPVGVTEDAVEEQELELDPSVEIIGSVKEINLEKVATLEPDLIMLSADLSAHMALKDSLEQMQIPYAYFRVDTFDDYKALMEQFCTVNETPDRFQINVTEVEERIHAILEKIPKTNASVLLMRAYSTGIKAKTDDNLAGQILKEFGLTNLADETPSLLEDLSVEQIILKDPDFIFVSTMGSEANAKAYLAENVENNPAWTALDAIQNNHYYLLPKDLFHYKPNERWDESYAYLAKIIFPEQFQ